MNGLTKFVYLVVGVLIGFIAIVVISEVVHNDGKDVPSSKEIPIKTTYYPRGQYITYAHRESDRLFGKDQWDELYTLWDEQSGWDYKLNHPRFGCGIPVVFPCSRISDDPKTQLNPYAQIDWGINYIKGRYGTPDKALEALNNRGWY